MFYTVRTIYDFLVSLCTIFVGSLFTFSMVCFVSTATTDAAFPSPFSASTAGSVTGADRKTDELRKKRGSDKTALERKGKRGKEKREKMEKRPLVLGRVSSLPSSFSVETKKSMGTYLISRKKKKRKCVGENRFTSLLFVFDFNASIHPIELLSIPRGFFPFGFFLFHIRYPGKRGSMTDFSFCLFRFFSFSYGRRSVVDVNSELGLSIFPCPSLTHSMLRPPFQTDFVRRYLFHGKQTVFRLSSGNFFWLLFV